MQNKDDLPTLELESQFIKNSGFDLVNIALLQKNLDSNDTIVLSEEPLSLNLKSKLTLRKNSKQKLTLNYELYPTTGAWKEDYEFSDFLKVFENVWRDLSGEREVVTDIKNNKFNISFKE